MGLYAAAYPAEATDTIIDENHVEPGTNHDRLQAWTDSTDGGDGKGFNSGGPITTTYAAADPENIGQAGLSQFEESGTWWKRNMPSQQRRARGRLG